VQQASPTTLLHIHSLGKKRILEKTTSDHERITSKGKWGYYGRRKTDVCHQTTNGIADCRGLIKELASNPLWYVGNSHKTTRQTKK